MNLYQVFDERYEWCCFVFDISRNRAKVRAAEHFGEGYISMRCKTLKRGINVEIPTIVDCEDDKEYGTVLKCGYRFYDGMDDVPDANDADRKEIEGAK